MTDAESTERLYENHNVVQITLCRKPKTFNDIVLLRSYSAVLVGGRWLHGATIADILEQI
jgi:hypothetical protein